MGRNKSNKKQLTYHQMEKTLCEVIDAVQQLIQRISNLEYGLFSYIEYRKTGKKFNKWMDKRHEAVQKKEEVKNAIQSNETTVREDLEGATASQGRRAERIRTP